MIPRSFGPRRACARKTMSLLGNVEWRPRTPGGGPWQDGPLINKDILRPWRCLAALGGCALHKQYEKFSTFLRNELCSNNLSDFGLKKGLDHLGAVRQTSNPSPTVSPASRRNGSMSTST